MLYKDDLKICLYISRLVMMKRKRNHKEMIGYENGCGVRSKACRAIRTIDC